MLRRGDCETRMIGDLDTVNTGPSRHPAGETAGPPDILVLGLGNALLTDDGAGVLVVEQLQQSREIPGEVTLIDGGTLSFSLLAAITDTSGLVVVDAAHMRLPPGAVRCFRGATMDRFLTRSGQSSVHEVGLSELLDMARLQDRLPARRALVAIQPENIGWGPGPTGSVAAALPRAMACVQARIKTWLS